LCRCLDVRGKGGGELPEQRLEQVERFIEALEVLEAHGCAGSSAPGWIEPPRLEELRECLRPGTSLEEVAALLEVGARFSLLIRGLRRLDGQGWWVGRRAGWRLGSCARRYGKGKDAERHNRPKEGVVRRHRAVPTPLGNDSAMHMHRD